MIVCGTDYRGSLPPIKITPGRKYGQARSEGRIPSMEKIGCTKRFGIQNVNCLPDLQTVFAGPACDVQVLIPLAKSG